MTVPRLLGPLTAVALAVTAGCGVRHKSEPPPPAPAATSAGAVADAAADYLGCSEYCLQAGEYGDPGGATRNAAEAPGDITLADVMLPVTVTCKLEASCQGAILILPTESPAPLDELGRSDLAVGGGATRTIAVKLTGEAVALLRQRGTLAVDVLLDTSPSGDECEAEDMSCVVDNDVTAHAGA
jgi:hypothetical protein